MWNRIIKNNIDYGVFIGGEEEYEFSDFEKRNKFIREYRYYIKYYLYLFV